ncbi:MAG: hypothetical protein B7Y99_03155 [Caulobacterales bacterium 32-69-10]|nr:MAG: hypothetical protein B7Y99_03155 [Caulobacterales bacterium 32-69-10]
MAIQAPVKAEPASRSDPEQGAPERVRALAGWVRVDTDAVIRGWVTDRESRSDRLAVEVLIDGSVAGVCVADRLDPKLVELGEGDGGYAFALVTPERYRDGRPHSFEARTADGLFRLKSKRADFEIAPGAGALAIEIDRAGYGKIEGALAGDWRGRPTGLELWRGDRRLPYPVTTAWTEQDGRARFAAHFPIEALDGGDMVLAAPGMIEAGLDGAVFRASALFAVAYDAEGALRVTVAEDWPELKGRALQLQVFRDGDPEPVLATAYDMDLPWFELLLPRDAAPEELSVGLAVEGLGLLPFRARPGAGPGIARHAGHGFEIVDAFLLLNNLYVVGSCVQSGFDIELTAVGDRAASIAPRGLATPAAEAASPGLLRPFAACFPIPDALYTALDTAEPQVVSTRAGPRRTARLRLDGAADWTGRVQPWRAELIALCVDPIERALFEAYGGEGLTMSEAPYRMAKLETAVRTEGGLLAAGWAVAVSERTTLLVDPMSLRHVDLGRSALLHPRKDVEAYLQEKRSPFAKADAGFILQTALPADRPLVVVGDAADGWVRMLDIGPDDRHRAETLDQDEHLRFVQTLSVVAPDRIVDLLSILTDVRPAPAPVAAPIRLRIGPAPEPAAARLTVVQCLGASGDLGLEGLGLQRGAGAETEWIVVDGQDGRASRLRSALVRCGPDISRPTLALSPIAPGLAADALNQGMAESRSDYVLLIGPNVHLRGLDAVWSAIEYLDDQPGVAACGFSLRFADGGLCRGALELRASGSMAGLRLLEQAGMGLPPRRQDTNPAPAEALAAALLLIRRADFPAEGFDRRYFGRDFLGADLCRRLQAAGRGVVIWQTDQAFLLDPPAEKGAPSDPRGGVNLIDAVAWSARNPSCA